MHEVGGVAAGCHAGCGSRRIEEIARAEAETHHGASLAVVLHCHDARLQLRNGGNVPREHTENTAGTLHGHHLGLEIFVQLLLRGAEAKVQGGRNVTFCEGADGDPRDLHTQTNAHAQQ
jgi:hypothetical protein